MEEKETYQPPKIWHWDSKGGGKWGSINRPISGATHDAELPTGKQPFQLYSLGTPNGQKVTIMLEELLELGEQGAEYDAFLIDIGKGDQFSSGFVNLNPNSKIPALLDVAEGVRVFESSSILVYLAEKFGHFLPQSPAERAEAMNWLFWSHGAAPFLGGGFGHFYDYAPIKIEYAIDRYAMETKRHLDVLDKHLAKNRFLAGDAYTIADIATWGWYGNLVRGSLYKAAEFLQVHTYENVCNWAEVIWQRPAVQRGRRVNRAPNPDDAETAGFIRERHDASDLK